MIKTLGAITVVKPKWEIEARAAGIKRLICLTKVCGAPTGAQALR